MAGLKNTLRNLFDLSPLCNIKLKASIYSKKIKNILRKKDGIMTRLSDFSSLNKEKSEISVCIGKIMNTLYFRKLSGKTQVILSLAGPDIRTRLTHTIEVAKISRDICGELGLNADLAEAIALSHDIGHTPFGHVGERTLSEIMCGCDTLGDKVRDCDFDNSGFKHNLQSFRILKYLEYIDEDIVNKRVWPYILWGAAIHTGMSYAEPVSGIEDEIYISSDHCSLVYCCYFHEKKECKRNILDRKKNNPQNLLCKPWYCATLPIETKEESKEDAIPPDMTKEEYYKKEYIKKHYQKGIYCKRKCYMAKNWEHKIKNRDVYQKFYYLFDHPFPNSYYAKYFYEYFYDDLDSFKDCVSLEAQIVAQADEIAQRQQDVEDGIIKGLIPIKIAQEHIIDLIKDVNEELAEKKIKGIHITKEIKDDAKSPEKLGEIIVDFYKGLLIKCTEHNFDKFQANTSKVQFNIYCLLYIVYSMEENKDKTPRCLISPKIKKWILNELDYLDSCNEINYENKFLLKYFDLSNEESYLYFIIYEYFDKLSKMGVYLDGKADKDVSNKLSGLDVYVTDKTDKEIFDKLIARTNLSETFSELLEEYEGFHNSDQITYLKMLEKIRDKLKSSYIYVYKEYVKNEGIWNIEHLTLEQFYALYNIFITYIENKKNIVSTIDIPEFNENMFKDKREYSPKVYFPIWKKYLKNSASQIIAYHIKFWFVHDDPENPINDALKDFKKKTQKTILKSEIVEKNDGKATYILKRLFKAYITNSHQLPDEGLKHVLFSLSENLNEFMQNENNDVSIAQFLKLRKTLIVDEKKAEIEAFLKNKSFIDITVEQYEGLIERTSNEIKSLLKNKKELYDFLKKIAAANSLQKILKSEYVKDSKDLKDKILKFREILDNPILNATPYWKSILARGICDYISNLTDQEAINEYEKLYTGVMDLI